MQKKFKKEILFIKKIIRGEYYDKKTIFLLDIKRDEVDLVVANIIDNHIEVEEAIIRKEFIGDSDLLQYIQNEYNLEDSYMTKHMNKATRNYNTYKIFEEIAHIGMNIFFISTFSDYSRSQTISNGWIDLKSKKFNILNKLLNSTLKYIMSEQISTNTMKS